MSSDSKGSNNDSVTQQSYRIIGYDTSFLSFSIVVVSLLSAIITANNTDISSFSLMDVNYSLLVLSLTLAGVDILKTYWRFRKNALVLIMRIVAILSVVLSAFVLLLTLLVHLDLCTIINCTKIGFNNNLSK